MKIRHKMYALMAIYIAGVLSVSILFVSNFQRNQQIRDSIVLGMNLQMKSRDVKSLMKDVIFDLFAPQTYLQTRSLTYSPRSVITITQWASTVEEYRQLFDRFMDSSIFLNSGDTTIRDQYLTAMIMNQKAMGFLTSMSDTITSVHDTYRLEDNIYNAMLKDASLNDFFNEFQETSYYFSNSFEGFMNYFIASLREEAEQIQRQQYLTLLLVAGAFFTIALASTIYLTRDIALKTRIIELAFGELALGNFKTEHRVVGNDEFGRLSSGLSDLVLSLKTNTDNILNLSRDVTGVINENSEITELHDIIVRAVLQDTSADAVLLFTRIETDKFKLSATSGRELSRASVTAIDNFILSSIFRSRQKLSFSRGQYNDRNVEIQIQSQNLPEAILALPLIIDNRNYGVLVAAKTSPGSYFSDLGITSLENFSEYVSLTIDHFFKYRELLERRQAQFLALQSQMQPHFIYNILGGMLGLLRMGNSEALRETIESLKTMLRYIQSSNKWTILEDELDFLRNYLVLQKIRFGERLDFSIITDSESNHVRIPRLLLQPLVENSVLHGIEPLEEGGFVRVEVEGIRRGGEQGAVVRITDNGAGFDDSIVESAANIGIFNLRQRLQIFMPESSLRIQSKPGEGTQVELRI